MRKPILLIIIILTLLSCSNEEESVQKTVQEETIEQTCDCSKTDAHFYQENGVMLPGDVLVTPSFTTDCSLNGDIKTVDMVFNGQLLRTISTITCIQK